MELSSRLNDCTVWVHHPKASGEGGTGFFVAPGLVLTCAYVLGKADHVAIGDGVTVRWRESDYAATVADAQPADKGTGRLWALPDLAVLRLVDPPPIHPSVWLDDAPIQWEAHLYVVGFNAIYGQPPELASAATVYTGPQRLGGHEMVRMKDDELAAGMSGGPVLNTTRGTVCGMVKTSRREGASSGGLAISATVIRETFPEVWVANANWQAEDGVWRRLRQSSCHENALAGLLTTAEMAALESAWAELEIPLDRLFSRMFGGLRPWPGAGLTGIRDLVCEAADTLTPLPGEEHPLLVLLEILSVAARDGSVLRRIATRVGGRLGLNDPVRPQVLTGNTAAIEILILPDGSSRSRYLLIIRIFHDLAEPPEVTQAGDEPLTLAKIQAQVGKLLPAYLKTLGARDRDITIEFTLPFELLCHQVEEWHTGKPWAPLGLEFPVLLRVSNRDPESLPAWRRKWRALHAGQTCELHWVDCRASGNKRQLLAEFQPDTRSVLAVTYRPDNLRGRNVLEAALRAGTPAAIWSASRCSGHKPGLNVTDCAGDKFRATISNRIRQAQLTDLPHLVKQLRAEAETSDGYPGRGLALLWDDPDRLYQIDETPLVGPL